MKETFVLTFIIFSVMVIAMSIGYILQGKCLAGSCGGLNKLFGSGSCDVCEEKKKCDKTIQ